MPSKTLINKMSRRRCYSPLTSGQDLRGWEATLSKITADAEEARRWGREEGGRGPLCTTAKLRCTKAAWAGNFYLTLPVTWLSVVCRKHNIRNNRHIQITDNYSKPRHANKRRPLQQRHTRSPHLIMTYNQWYSALWRHYQRACVRASIWTRSGVLITVTNGTSSSLITWTPYAATTMDTDEDYGANTDVNKEYIDNAWLLAFWTKSVNLENY